MLMEEIKEIDEMVPKERPSIYRFNIEIFMENKFGERRISGEFQTGTTKETALRMACKQLKNLVDGIHEGQE